MKAPDDLRTLLHQLLQASQEERVNWVPYTSNEGFTSVKDDFVVHFPGYSLNIWPKPEDYSIAFAILDTSGEPTAVFDFQPNDPDYAVVEELLDLARLKAIRLDQILADLRGRLAEGKEIGKPPDDI